MFIKNQTFNDIETLEESLFDFDLGEASPTLREAKAAVQAALAADAGYQEQLAAEPDEEERMALADEEEYARLAALLMERYDGFEIRDRKLYALKDEGKKDLLAEIDLV